MNTKEMVIVCGSILGAGVFTWFEAWPGVVMLSLVAVCATIDYCTRSR